MNFVSLGFRGSRVQSCQDSQRPEVQRPSQPSIGGGYMEVDHEVQRLGTLEV
jgi:hypothetical protein